MRQGQSRRRGRGGPRPPQQGGGSVGRGPEMGNRNDHRNRGNANQLWEKYKTLARDAQMQGDRITAEYYMQYADHYYRVLNENRPRADENQSQQGQQQQRPRRDWEEDDRDYQRDDRRPSPVTLNGSNSDVDDDEDGDGGETIASVLPPAFNRQASTDRYREDDEEERPAPRRDRRPRRDEAPTPAAAARPEQPRAEPPRAEAAPAGEEAPRRRRGRPRTRPEGESGTELKFKDA